MDACLLKRWLSDLFEVGASKLPPVACRVFERAPHDLAADDGDQSDVFVGGRCARFGNHLDGSVG